MSKEKSTQEFEPMEILRLLNQSLEVEYSFIVNYPRLASMIKNTGAKNMMIKLGEDSMHHADVVAGIITELGGTPNWNFQMMDSIEDLPAILKQQLEKEELAVKLHERTAAMAPGQELRKRLAELGDTEHHHIRAVQKIIADIS